MGEILVGTSGFAYDDWHGTFYPKALDRDRRLRFYADAFPIVEINATHYHMPSADRVRSMTERMTEAGLQAAVFKAPRSITHEAMPHGRERRASDRLTSFFQALQPAGQNDVLDGVLVQFSHRADPNTVLAGVEQALENDPPAPLFVEVRHSAFEEERYQARLREFVEPEGGLVATDSPSAKITRAPPSDQAYFRFHGRNREMWFQQDPPGVHGSARYDDLYSGAQIEELAERVRAADARRVRVFFNNHVGGQAPANARQLMDALGIGPPRDRVTLDDFE